MTRPRFSEAELTTSFSAAHESKYELGPRIGAGAYGITFRAHDKHRDIDVCVKLFQNGAAPVGAPREWRATSEFKHASIAGTYTVETFTVDDLGTAHAVVSELIPGRNLKEVLHELSHADDPNAASGSRRELYQQGVGGICTALAHCHERGVGHGDLHAGNIMISADADAQTGKLVVSATLIDFDNATYGMIRPRTEEELMTADIGAVRELVPRILAGSCWREEIDEFFQSARTATDLVEVFNLTRRILPDVEVLNPGDFPPNKIESELRAVMAARTARREYANAYHLFVEAVAARLGRTSDYEQAQARLVSDLKAGLIPKVSLEGVQVTDVGERAAIIKLLGGSG